MKSLLDHINRFSQLPKTALRDLSKVLHKVELKKGQFLTTEGKVCNHVYFLEQGCLRGFYNLDGKEITYWFGFEDSFVTSFFSFISRKPAVENIQVLEDCILWATAYDDLQALYGKHKGIERLGKLCTSAIM